MSFKLLLTWQTSAFGGVERRMMKEIGIVRSLGWDVVVSIPTFHERSRVDAALESHGVRSLRWNPYKIIEREHTALPFRLMALSTRQAVIRERFDLAHIPLPWTTVGLSRALVLRESGVPFVLSFRCRYPMAVLQPRTRRLVARALEGMVGGYGVSKSALESFKSNFGDLLPAGIPLSVIANGIDLERFRRDPAARKSVRDELGILHDEFVIIFCGRLEGMKRPQLAARAFVELRRRLGRGHLIVLGEGSMHSDIESILRDSGQSAHASMVGFRNDVERFLSAADVYLACSLNEGSPSAACEALSASLPAVVSDDPPYRETLAGCPAVEFVRSSDPAVWAQALAARVHRDNAQPHSAKDAARSFATHYLSDERMCSELLHFYSRLRARALQDAKPV